MLCFEVRGGAAPFLVQISLCQPNFPSPEKHSSSIVNTVLLNGQAEHSSAEEICLVIWWPQKPQRGRSTDPEFSEGGDKTSHPYPCFPQFLKIEVIVRRIQLRLRAHFLRTRGRLLFLLAWCTTIRQDGSTGTSFHEGWEKHHYLHSDNPFFT